MTANIVMILEFDFHFLLKSSILKHSEIDCDSFSGKKREKLIELGLFHKVLYRNHEPTNQMCR